MQRLLIHPPFADPTQPYLSLPVLKGHLRAHGLDARVLDLNVEAAHFLFLPESIDDLARRLGLRFLKLNHASTLGFAEQCEYKAIVDARPGMERVLAADPPPLDVFRRRDLFYDAARYAMARRHVDALFEALSALHYPFRFDFNQAAHEILPWSLDLLESYWKERQSPLDAFYRKVFTEVPDWDEGKGAVPSIPLDDLDFVGISVVFPSQIAEAFYIARLLREAAPHAFIAFGGPCMHQIALRVDPPVLGRMLEAVDGIGIFEGEETLAKLFPILDGPKEDGGKVSSDALRSVPNLLHLDRRTGKVERGPFQLLDLSEAAPPDYSDLDLDRYLSPGRILLYAPTRGCYWNRCSFCHYGLSETATAKYREIPPDRAVGQLARLAQKHGVRNFYISCDVLSPSYATKLAQMLIQRGLKIRWSSDLKIEASYTPERCQELYRSGLRAAAFGMESGSDRVLALIRKGCDRATLSAVSRSFHAAGIATEWMTFTDHPGETVEEAIETVRWIEAEKEHVDLFIIGEFGLEHGSDIASNPARYGIDVIYHAEGDELRFHPLHTSGSGKRSAADRERIDQLVRRLGSEYALRPYPWAGAVSTHHTFLHLLEFGPRAFRLHFQRAGAENEGALGTPAPSHIAGLRERPRFSVEAIERRTGEFLRRYLPEALRLQRDAAPDGRGKPSAPLSLHHFSAASAEVEPLRSGKDR